MSARRRVRKERIRDRPTGDLLILMIAGTVCFSILASGALIGALAIWRPGTDLSFWVVRVTGLINTLVGLLAGFLAGRNSMIKPKDTDETMKL